MPDPLEIVVDRLVREIGNDMYRRCARAEGYEYEGVWWELEGWREAKAEFTARIMALLEAEERQRVATPPLLHEELPDEVLCCCGDHLRPSTWAAREEVVEAARELLVKMRAFEAPDAP